MSPVKSVNTTTPHGLRADSPAQGSANDGEILAHAAAEQVPSEPTSKARKRRSEDDEINLNGIPQWPGSGPQVKRRKRYHDDGRNNLHEIPELPGSVPEAETFEMKAHEHDEVDLWDVPEGQSQPIDAAYSMEMPIPTIEDIDGDITAADYGPLDDAELEDWDESQPQNFFYDGDDPEEYEFLMREAMPILLQMEEMGDWADTWAANLTSQVLQGGDATSIIETDLSILHDRFQI